jgi:uncharacterized protein (TIRG00374 family)
MKKVFSWRNMRRWLPGVLISLVALVAVLQFGSWNDFKLAFTAVRPVNLGIAIVLTIISLGTRAQAWRTLLEKKASLWKAFIVINEGYLLNTLFPLRAGEIGRAVFMGRASGLGTFHVLSTIVIERMFDLVCAAILLLSTLTMVPGFEWTRPIAIVTLALVGVGLVVLYLAARYNARIQLWIEGFAGRWGWFKRLILPKMGSLMEGLRVLTRPAVFLQAFFWLVISWVMAVFIYWEMLLIISPASPVWHGAFVDAVLAMGIAIPSAPGALGIFEGSIIAALKLIGITTGAIGYAFLMHLFQACITGILGFLGLISEGRSLSSAFAEIQTSEQSS